MKVSGTFILYGTAALAIGALAWYVVKKGGDLADTAGEAIDQAKEAAKDALNAVNPANPDNVFARAANTATQAVTGEKDITLGTKIGDWLRPGDNDLVAPTPLNVRPGALVYSPYVGDLPLASDPLKFSPYVGDIPTSFDRPAIVDGSGGAAFGLYPNPFRSK